MTEARTGRQDWSMKACPKCETLWDDGKRFCPYHGLPLTPAPEAVPEAVAPVDAEITVRMSEEERARLFTPQFLMSAVSSEAGAAAALEAAQPVAASSPPVAEAFSIEDPPTAKSSNQASPVEPSPPELDLFIPPTVVVSPAALPPPLGAFIPPTVMVAPAEAEVAMPAPADAEASAPTPVTTAAPVSADDGLPLTRAVPELRTSRLDPAATIVQAGQVGPVGPCLPPPLPPAASPDDEVAFILDLGEKSGACLPPPAEAKPAEAEPAPPARAVTPSAVPALVTPPSPTIKRRTAVQYFKLFNERKKVIQQFVQRLDPKKARVVEGHSNQEDHLMHRYDIAFRCLGAARAFPLVIILQRKPVYALITSVDLFEIAENPLLRAERVKSLGGEARSTPNGVIYHLSYGEDLPTEGLDDWLKATFQAIAGLLPGASL
ncbi:MAG: hypothetical protein CFK52_08780 [Chloracidobacterium sp. CP2_5A]|nr:MAG: hypothetical protein CFK52_08780 [Chloracidobacterium sp. CP2_5A]